MPKINVLPHETLCPNGAEFDVASGANLIQALLDHDIQIEHACEMQCACATCHVYIREGYDSVNIPSDKEDAMLDKAWGLDMDSRLSCQTVVGDQDLVIELPKYSRNLVSEKNV